MPAHERQYVSDSAESRWSRNRYGRAVLAALIGGWALLIHVPPAFAQACSDAPACAAGVFCSGFEEGNKAIWDDYDGNPDATNLLMTDPGPCARTGNHVMRLRVPAGRGGADLIKMLPSTHDKLYARWYQKWEPGYDFTAADSREWTACREPGPARSFREPSDRLRLVQRLPRADREDRDVESTSVSLYVLCGHVPGLQQSERILLGRRAALHVRRGHGLLQEAGAARDRDAAAVRERPLVLHRDHARRRDAHHESGARERRAELLDRRRAVRSVDEALDADDVSPQSEHPVG